MPPTIAQATFTTELFSILEETFETHHGIYLDKGTSLFETLDTISAAEASRPVGGQCASLAAQVTHVIFYLDVLEKVIRKQPIGQIDWGEIWRTVEAVTPQQWEALKQNLHVTYQRISGLLHGLESWDDSDILGGSLAIVVHTAYHLGEIRQALCTLNA